MPTRVVTLSHATGAGGESIGRTVATRLGFRYIDEEIIEIAAQREGIDAALVADEERRKSFLERLLAGMADPPIGDTSAGMMMPGLIVSRSESVRTVIVDSIREVAQRGQAVIVSHAASIPLADRADVLRVLITASAGTREQRVGRDGRIGTGDAARFIKDNTDTLSADEAAEIIAAAARLRA